MASKENLDKIVAAMAEVQDPGWSSDYYLLRYRRRLLIPRVKGPRVLELGCAEGGVTRELVKLFPEVVAVDGSPRLIAKAKAEIPADNVIFECCLLEDYKPTHQFDSIVAACVLEHIEQPVPVFERMRQLLSPEGTIHVTVPNAGSLNRRVGLAMGLLRNLDELHERDIRQGHYRVYSLDTLRADMEAAGLTMTYNSGNFLKPLSDAQMAGWDERMLDAFAQVGNSYPELCSEIYAECKAV